jgi:hypothetical protein
MDGSKLDGLKHWKCENGHVLGIVERVQASNKGNKYYVSRLMLFRIAIDLEPAHFVSLEDVDVIANIEGTVMDIRCSCCGSIRTWWMGEATLARFMENRKEKV